MSLSEIFVSKFVDEINLHFKNEKFHVYVLHCRQIASYYTAAKLRQNVDRPRRQRSSASVKFKSYTQMLSCNEMKSEEL